MPKADIHGRVRKPRSKVERSITLPTGACVALAPARKKGHLIVARGGTKYDAEVHPVKVLELAAQGITRSEIAIHLGILPTTFWNWMKSHSEFREAVHEGDALGEMWWYEQGRRNLHNKEFNVALYVFNMVNRYGWTKGAGETRVVINQGGRLGRRVDVDVSQFSDEELAILAVATAKALPVRDERKLVPDDTEEDEFPGVRLKAVAGEEDEV